MVIDLIEDQECTLEDLEAGSLFKFNMDGYTCIGFKSEYATNTGRIDAYVVGSGEAFWGGTKSPAEQRLLIVTPLTLIK